jgi:hypothetical protein
MYFGSSVRVLISLFGRACPPDLDLAQAENS